MVISSFDVVDVSSLVGGRGRGPRMEPVEPPQKTALEDRPPSHCTVPHPVFSTITTSCDNRIVIHTLPERNVVTDAIKGTYVETEGSRFT